MQVSIELEPPQKRRRQHRRLLESLFVQVVTRVDVNNLDTTEPVKLLLREAYSDSTLQNELQKKLPALTVRACAPYSAAPTPSLPQRRAGELRCCTGYHAIPVPIQQGVPGAWQPPCQLLVAKSRPADNLPRRVSILGHMIRACFTHAAHQRG